MRDRVLEGSVSCLQSLFRAAVFVPRLARERMTRPLGCGSWQPVRTGHAGVERAVQAAWQAAVPPPWGNEYIYVCPGIHNTDGFDLSSAGRDGQPGTADDITNWGQ